MKGYGQGRRAGFRQSKALTERQTRERSTNFTSPNMSCEVTASLGYLPFAPRRARRLDWVESSSWKDGEAAVHRRLTLERQMTSTLLPDCAIKPPAAEADQYSVSPRVVRPLHSETCCWAIEMKKVSSNLKTHLAVFA